MGEADLLPTGELPKAAAEIFSRIFPRIGRSTASYRIPTLLPYYYILLPSTVPPKEENSL